jgi:hypothetical protein
VGFCQVLESLEHLQPNKGLRKVQLRFFSFDKFG